MTRMVRLFLLIPFTCFVRTTHCLPTNTTTPKVSRPRRHRRDLVPDKQLRIWNGDDSSVGAYPFVAVILANSAYTSTGDVAGQNVCGGSILNSRVILTAAHCVVKYVELSSGTVEELHDPGDLVVYVGETHLVTVEPSEQGLYVAGIILHEDYDSKTVANDVAMLILQHDIALDENVAPISLPQTSDVDVLYAEGSSITVVGWGTTETGQTSDMLQELQYVVTSTDDCETTYREQILPGMFCTGASPMTQHSGTGDSGGPLFTKHNGVWTLLGLVSWAAEDHGETTYDVNADVEFFKAWITLNRDKALTEYVTSLPAGSSEQTVTYSNIRNFLYKTTTITAIDSKQYSVITITSGTMSPGDYLMIHDGNNINTPLLAQLTGTLDKLTFTASSSAGITLVIVTSKSGVSQGFTLVYRQVSSRGVVGEVVCSDGFSACKDRLRCVPSELFCDGTGQCADGSDENCADSGTGGGDSGTGGGDSGTGGGDGGTGGGDGDTGSRDGGTGGEFSTSDLLQNPVTFVFGVIAIVAIGITCCVCV